MEKKGLPLMSGQRRVLNEWVPKRNIFFVFMGLWAGIAWAYNKTTRSLLFSIEIEKWAQNTSACENRNTQGGWQTKLKLCSMWLFRPVMNSSARNDRMAILRNSFNSASLRANVIFFSRRIQDNWWCVKWSSVVTYYHLFFFIGTQVWLIAMFQTLLLALRTVHHLCEDKHLPSSPIYCRYQSQHMNHWPCSH